MELFECKIKLEKLNEKGEKKAVTETYLVDATGFADAEYKFIEEMTPYISGDYRVEAIKRTKIVEVFDSNRTINEVDAEATKLLGLNSKADADYLKYYECKVNYLMEDEKTGKPKKEVQVMYVLASSLNAAHDTLVEGMKGSMADWEMGSITETKVLDIFK